MIIAAVLGSPIHHSLSPLLHTFAYRYLGIDGRYTSYEVKAGELASFLQTQGDQMTGLSLTMPLKEEALTLAGQISPLAAQISSANTLYKVNEEWSATSTDVEGFTKALEFNQVNVTGDVLIIGSGATARAAVAALDLPGVNLHVLGRSLSRISSISAAAKRNQITFLPWEPTNLLNTANLVINTTPANTAEFFLDSIDNPKGVFFEVIYSPWPTRLMDRFSKSSQIVDGVDLLVHQGISQIEIFAGATLDRDELAPALRAQALSVLA